MSIAHTSYIRIEKHQGPHRTAHIEGFADAVDFGIHGGIPTAQEFYGSAYSRLWVFGAMSQAISHGMKYPVYFIMFDSTYEPRMKGLVSTDPMPPYTSWPSYTPKPVVVPSR